MTSVAVIGGGVFGCVGALEMAKAGHKVTLFEKEESILSKGTENSQNRLHLGLHYPRDIETARQSVLGFQSFLGRFSEAVDFDFPNYYALAAENSRTTRESFLEFAQNADIAIREINSTRLQSLGADPSHYSGIWLCDEGVIDIPTLKFLIRQELESSGVRINYGREIRRANYEGNWTLFDQLNESHQFDTVFRCTYGSDSIEIAGTSFREREYEYHKTAILNVSLNQPRFGFTVIDGDFLTILPDGKSNRSLLYAPSISTLFRHQGSSHPETWNSTSSEQLDSFTQAILDRAQRWLPSIEINKFNRVMLAIRTIQPNVSSTDRRTSSISQVAENFYDVWSGKIDHCVDLSSEMVNLL